MTPAIGPLTDAVNHLKGRIGEAFVEALLRRANYSVSRVGREAHLPSLLKAGPTAYMPDFLAWREERIPGPQGDRSTEPSRLSSGASFGTAMRRRSAPAVAGTLPGESLPPTMSGRGPAADRHPSATHSPCTGAVIAGRARVLRDPLNDSTI